MQPDFEAKPRTRPWEMRIPVLEGRMTVVKEGVAHVCKAGDTFSMAAHCGHFEKYGPAGSTYVPGRREGASAPTPAWIAAPPAANAGGGPVLPPNTARALCTAQGQTLPFRHLVKIATCGPREGILLRRNKKIAAVLPKQWHIDGQTYKSCKTAR